MEVQRRDIYVRVLRTGSRLVANGLFNYFLNMGRAVSVKAVARTCNDLQDLGRSVGCMDVEVSFWHLAVPFWRSSGPQTVVLMCHWFDSVCLKVYVSISLHVTKPCRSMREVNRNEVISASGLHTLCKLLQFAAPSVIQPGSARLQCVFISVRPS